MKRGTLVRWLTRVLFAGALAGAVGTWWTWYVIERGTEQLKAARAYAAAGKLDQAIVSARRAATWYAPGAPHVTKAYAKLISLGRLAESRGDRKTALFAYRSLRSAAMTSRSWFIPHERELRAANHAIARLSSRTPPPIGASMQEPKRIEQSLLASYDAPPPTNPSWIAIMLTSAAVSSVGLLYAGWKGLQDSRIHRKKLLLGAAVFLFGLAGWVVAVWFA